MKKKKNKKNKQQINYLDLIPVRPEKLGWHIDRRERVVLEVKNEGFFNRIAQTYFRRPQTTKVHLDVQGSYLWPLIDGERDRKSRVGKECLRLCRSRWSPYH